MFELIDIPTEQTTAFTDLILAMLSVILLRLIYIAGIKVDRQKVKIWTGIFGLLALASILGAIAHGFKMSEQLNLLLWQPLNLALGITVALFIAAIIYDWKNFIISSTLLAILIIIAFVFYVITLLFPGGFLIFIIYEAIAMIFALLVYFILFLNKKINGAGYMVIGILFSILAAVVQTINSIQFVFIWIFDQNGAFHLLQIPGLVFLTTGLRIEFKTRKTNSLV